jgi:hypothetical protein
MLNALAMLTMFLTDAQQSITVAKLPPVSVTRDGVDWLLVIFSAVLAVAGLVGIFLAWKTVLATRDNAKAALKQANYMVASERARLVIRAVNKGEIIGPIAGPREFRWQIQNVGKTPARLIQTQAVCQETQSWNDLPTIPIFLHDPFLLHKSLLTPGESLEFHTYWTNEQGLEFKDVIGSSDCVAMRAYGYIKYLTVMGDEPCVSRFCVQCVCSLKDREIRFHPYFQAPAAYTEHT